MSHKADLGNHLFSYLITMKSEAKLAVLQHFSATVAKKLHKILRCQLNKLKNLGPKHKMSLLYSKFVHI